MAYEIMYEGDGFIRKGPEPKELPGKEVADTAPKKDTQVQPEKKPVRRGRGGITMFRFTRLVFR